LNATLAAQLAKLTEIYKEMENYTNGASGLDGFVNRTVDLATNVFGNMSNLLNIDLATLSGSTANLTAAVEKLRSDWDAFKNLTTTTSTTSSKNLENV
jgi:hypothetical protein